MTRRVSPSGTRIAGAVGGGSYFGNAEVLVVPNSGVMAGLFSRVQGAKEGGISDQPAGTAAAYLFVPLALCTSL